MGAYDFENLGAGTDADAVFHALVEQAQWEHGHGGYSGTIAEKGSFIMVEAEPLTYRQAQHQITAWHNAEDGLYRPRKMPVRQPSYAGFSYYGGIGAAFRTGGADPMYRDGGIDISDKWGPAACIEIKRAGIPADVLVRTFGQDVPVTREEVRRDLYGRRQTVTVYTSERRAPKRGTRFFVFFGYASS